MADLKPPFPSSPIRIRHRSVLRTSIPNTAAAQNQMGSVSKTQSVTRSITSEFQELTKMINNEKPNSSNCVIPDKSKPSPLFERGRFYEEYSARRNERLKRKKISEEGEENKTICDLSFVSEPVKRRNVKKLDDFKSSVVSKTPLIEIKESVNPIPRYSLRSRTKENKMPPLPPSSINSVGGGRKQAVSRARKS
ncbi:uncharacterized protein LOC124927989 [Impatiens glandulifera]|uniref:uncharacterized protein LOC124927989 n=1 Tax=Impatiens glandulifera TaxID=253017 RepID=UPI001FB17C3F|nr:uncharacterized protein LOC124927989 [Impatiens glandulifera]